MAAPLRAANRDRSLTPNAPEQVESAMAEAVLPDLVELRDAFERAKPLVGELARKAGSAA